MSRGFNYTFLSLSVIIFIICLFKIGSHDIPTSISNDEEKENGVDNKINIKTFLLPCIVLLCFFVGCYYSALIVENVDVKIDKYCGIFYLIFIGLILLVTNFTVFDKEKLLKYIGGKKFSKIGVIMFIGIGAIIFGFIDNFGMRLGTEALDDIFVQSFLSPLSVDTRFTKHQDNIQENFKIINKWNEHDWRKVMNHVLRFKDEISKNKKMSDLTNVLDSFGCEALKIPKEVLKNRNTTNNFVDNLRSKYDIIEGSKGMLGNTFSNFCAGLLGAGVIGLFTYLTSYDDMDVGDDKLEHYKNIVEKISPILEAVFILIGCLIPVFLNIAMKRSDFNNNSRTCWIIICVVLLAILFMMYYSYKNIETMTIDNKKNGIKNTLNKIKLRYDINDKNNTNLNTKIDNFKNSLFEH